MPLKTSHRAAGALLAAGLGLAATPIAHAGDLELSGFSTVAAGRVMSGTRNTQLKWEYLG